MGTCYSTNTVAVKSSSESRIPKEKHRGSKRKFNAKEWSHKRIPIKPCEVGSDDVVSRSCTPDFVSEHSNEKVPSSGVVPSDSGIESLDNIPDDAGETAQSVKVRDALDIKCMQNTTPFSENSTDSKTTIIIDCSHNGISASNFKPNSENNKYVLHPKQSPISLYDTSSLLPSQEMNKHTNSNISIEKLGSHKVPMTELDSVEANLNDTSFYFNQKRQSLLSEILDMTQTLCKSDFYPSEYNKRDHEINGAGTQVNNGLSSSKISVRGQFYENNHNLNQTSRAEHALACSCTNSPQKFSSPNKTGASLTKNVSFATHEDFGSEVITALTSSPVTSKQEGQGCLKSSLLESHKTKSELILSKHQKDFHKRSASLGSVRTLTNDSCSDVPDCNTEDDMASLDLDSISRVTSLSYSSIRQLMESTEDIVSLCHMAQPVTIDGVECIVIPTAAYFQMQKDLATLKQQLLYLSSLMQGTEEEL